MHDFRNFGEEIKTNSNSAFVCLPPFLIYASTLSHEIYHTLSLSPSLQCVQNKAKR